MSFIKNLFGIYDCTDCGNTIYFGGKRCHGFDIEHHRKVGCWSTICDSCTYQFVTKDHTGTLILAQNYCQSHFERRLFKLTFEELDELQYHGSYMSNSGNYVSITGDDCEEILDTIINLKKNKTRQKEQQILDENIENAKNLEIAGRYNESALLYEELKMWKKAGKIRKKMKENVTKHIHIDANDLFRQIKHEGLAIPYKCPNCSGTLKIDGMKKFEECPYCGTDLDLQTLTSLVETLLD